jgi:hypothetical protein
MRGPPNFLQHYFLGCSTLMNGTAPEVICGMPSHFSMAAN